MANVTLLIMRHAKSDWDTGVNHDFDRPLSNRGLRDASHMGKWLLSEELIPDQIIASPALRAKQTTELLCKTAGIKQKKVSWDKSVYSSGIQNLLDLARESFKKNRKVMFVGHNPVMEELLHFLSRDSVSATETGKYMTTANVAVVELDPANKNFLDEGSGRLIIVARPKEI